MSRGSDVGVVALASGNAHKAREWRELLPDLVLQTLDMDGAPPETGETFSENALAKARYGALVAPPSTWVIGEDSGLMVDVLDGAPGVRSARFAGHDASDADNLARLLAELGSTRTRQAQFQCAVACVSPSGEEFEASGSVRGSIAREVAGESGFGYDPVFVPHGETRTIAELGAAWKRQNSHRARAARRVSRLLEGAGSSDVSDSA